MFLYFSMSLLFSFAEKGKIYFLVNAFQSELAGDEQSRFRNEYSCGNINKNVLLDKHDGRENKKAEHSEPDGKPFRDFFALHKSAKDKPTFKAVY